MSELQSEEMSALDLENAARAREAGWLGFATLMLTMMFYLAALGVAALIWQMLNDTIGGFTVGEIGIPKILHDFSLGLLPPLLISPTITLYFIVRVGRRRGIGFFHHGESASGIATNVFPLISVIATATILLWVIFIGEGHALMGHLEVIMAVFFCVCIGNMLPSVILGYVWARLLEWSRKRWGKSLERLPISTESPETP